MEDAVVGQVLVGVGIVVVVAILLWMWVDGGSHWRLG